jgi:hypothetical protein
LSGVSTITLDLLGLTVDSVVMNNNLMPFNQGASSFTVDLGFELVPAVEQSITVYYRGIPPEDASGFGGFSFSGGFAYNIGVGFLADPHNFGRVWFPCFDNFVERATMGINIQSKLPKRGYAVGTFLGETVISNDTILRSYRMDQPLTTYITHMAVSEYTQVDYTHNALNGPLPFQLVARAADTTAMRNTFTGLGDAVDALGRAGGARLPVLALNTPATDAPLPLSMLAFGLRIEDEARSIVRALVRGPLAAGVSSEAMPFAVITGSGGLERRAGAAFVAAASRLPCYGVHTRVINRLQRLAGLDGVIMPGFGARMGMDEAEVVAGVQTCLAPLGSIAPSLPIPGGSEWAGTLEGVYRRVGSVDFGFIPGRGVFGHPMGPAAGATSVRQAWDAISAGRTLEEQALGCSELKAAVDSFGGA